MKIEYLLSLCAVLLLYLAIKTHVFNDTDGQYRVPPVEIDEASKTFNGTLYLDAVYYGAVPSPESYTHLDTLYNAHRVTPFLTVVYIINGQDTLGYYPITSK